MTLIQYTAEVKSGLLLELPAEAETLHLKPGDKIQVQIDAGQEQATAPIPALDDKAKAAIAWLDARIAEGMNADPETKRHAEEELAEFKHNMNANRAATGERLVYP